MANRTVIMSPASDCSGASPSQPVSVTHMGQSWPHQISVVARLTTGHTSNTNLREGKQTKTSFDNDSITSTS
eukprot:208280-Heterocapsa_arctica.AAC.2